MYPIGCFVATLKLLFGIYNAYIREDIDSVAYLVLWSIWAIAIYAAYFLGQRFKDKTMLMIVSLYVSAHILFIVRVEEMKDKGTDEVEIIAWLRAILNLVSSVSMLLLSPSIDYILFCFAPCHVITLVICVFHFDLERSFFFNMFGWFIGITIFWLVLQKRELKRFYEQQDAKIKETKAREK